MAPFSTVPCDASTIAGMKAQILAMQASMEEQQKILDERQKTMERGDPLVLPPSVRVDDVLRGYRVAGAYAHRDVRVVDVRDPVRKGATAMQVRVVLADDPNEAVSGWKTLKAFQPLKRETELSHRYRRVANLINPVSGMLSMADALCAESNDIRRVGLLGDIIFFTTSVPVEEHSGVGIMCRLDKTRTPWKHAQRMVLADVDTSASDILFETRRALPGWMQPYCDLRLLRMWAHWIDARDEGVVLEMEHGTALADFIKMINL